MLTLAVTLSIFAAAPADSQPETVIYERNMPMPDVPVVFPEWPENLSELRERENEQFGIAPLTSYSEAIRYVASWRGGHERPARPWVNKYIIQIALAGDGSRAQVLLLESESPPPAGRSPISRSIGWMPPSEFAELRRQVLQDAASLSEPESRLALGRPYCSHTTLTRLELHSAGPAQIELTRQATCGSGSAYRAGEHVIEAAEGALGRSIRRP